MQAIKKDGKQSDDFQVMEKFDVVEAATSTEDLQQLQYLFQATTSTEDLSPQQLINVTPVKDLQQSQHMVEVMTSTEDLSPQHHIVTTISNLPQHMTQVMTSTEDLVLQQSIVTTPTRGISWAQDNNKQVILVDVGIMTEQDFNINKAYSSSESSVFMELKEDAAPACMSDTELSQKNVESDTKRGNPSEVVLEGSTELSKRLQEKEHEVEQLQKLNVQLSEILNQAYAENLRLKEVWYCVLN